ncbi:thymidylate kinase, partial [Ascodesmis nigricans]
LIAVEGLDRSGKTTQCSHLFRSLTTLSTKTSLPSPQLLKFPDRTTTTGQLINTYLTSSLPLADESIHLLFSSNRWEARAQILSLLESGVTVILDRYVYSGIAFSAAKGLDYGWCRSPDVGLPKPDLVVFLDVEEEVQKERGGWGEERYETIEMQRRVREVFRRLREEEGGWWVVDAGKGEEEV